MELWEKEYLEIIQQRKRAPGKSSKIRINKCWEEVTRPDGSKLYIPKQESFRKQTQKQHRQSRMCAGLKKSGRVLLIAALIFAIIFVLVSLNAYGFGGLFRKEVIDRINTISEKLTTIKYSSRWT